LENFGFDNDWHSQSLYINLYQIMIMMIETELQLPVEPSSNNFLQIDILKGLMIMLVIIDHAIPTNVRAQWGHSLWERISIPVFLIIMGFNAANSFKKKDVPLFSFNSFLKYCLRKIKRYLIPFAVLYIISSIFGLIKYGSFESILQNQFDGHWGRALLWIFILPFYGPGNWFIPVLVSSVIVMPFLYYAYQKSPKITLFLSVLWEIGMQYFIFAFYGHWTDWWPNVPFGRTMLQLSVFLYFNALVLGFWFADHKDICTTSETSEMNTQDEVQDETQDGAQETFIKEIEPVKKKLPYHFYIALISVILITMIFIGPKILVDGEPRSIGFTILLIFLVVGLYTYRPLWEFLIILIISLAFVVGFSLLIDKYSNSTYINYESFTIEAGVGLFFLNIAIFILPYIVNVFYSPKNKNWFIWILFLMSGTYIIYYQFGFRFFLLTGDYHFFVYPHSAFIVLLFLKMIPKKSNFVLLKGFAYVGKATYHILLTQIFVYGIMLSTFGEHYFQGALQDQFLNNPDYYNLAAWIYVLIMWMICIPIGVLWYLIEKKVFSYIKDKKNSKEQIQTS